ncbi:IS110 family transposase ISAs16 [Aeromonas hydrophila]
MKATTIGIDLAKHLFQLHGVDQHGKTVLKRQLKRDQMLSFFTNLPPSLIGMEACGSAHYWANKLQGMGHTVKLMAPQFVKPYVKTNKNDAADAEAICEAVTRPNMRFVPIKNGEQLGRVRISTLHNETEKISLLNSNTYKGAFLCLVTYSHLP